MCLFVHFEGRGRELALVRRHARAGVLMMKDSVRVAMAIAAGYYLGRRHKMRLAAALIAAGAAGRMRGGEGGLMDKALKTIGASPELEEVFGRLRGDLTEVSKAAAVAATSRQVDTISTKLHDRTEALRTPAESGTGNDEESVDSEEEEPQEEEKPKRKPQLAGKSRR
jgi:hypothetical protein